jgi:hypothetical protein
MVVATCAVVTCALAPGCGGRRGPDLQIVGESTRIRIGDAVPAATPWFDGASVSLMAARGEVIGIQVLHRGGGPVTLAIPGDGVSVAGYAVEAIAVPRPSTALYGGSHGAGSYADGLTPAVAPATDPAYFEIRVDASATPGGRHGELVVGDRRVPVTLAIAQPVLPALARTVWAYEDPREIGDPAAERRCIAMFASYGVLLSPDLHLEDWPARKELLAGEPYVPVILPDDPAAVGPVVKGWLDATAGTGQVPFAIPIDEPRKPEARRKVRALADAVRTAGGGPGKLLYAVTDEPRPEYGDAVDLYITLRPHLADQFPRWTYNGAPPRAGAMVLDAETPGPRTWGVIGWRYQIPVWYVWDALYWHDRHNKKRALDLTDPTSFDDGEDHGNLDGVLALPGCRPTLRLAALRRGLYDRALLDAAARCDRARTEQLASRLVPRALGDAEGDPAWPTDEGAWERARRELIELASCAGSGRAPR